MQFFKNSCFYICMGKFILKLAERFLSSKNKPEEKYFMSAQNSTSKVYLNATETLSLTCTTEKKKTKLEHTVKNIVKKNIKTPQKLLEYVEKAGTPVYKIKYADKILNLIGEDEGFITPHKGFKALYLNLILDKKFALKTKAMFVLRNLPVNIYSMAHQFHKWYGYRMDLPGFDDETQLMFKQIWKYANKKETETLSLNEILSLKEAIQRDVEAIDFVINLSKENSGAKNSLQKIVEGKGAKL